MAPTSLLLLIGWKGEHQPETLILLDATCPLSQQGVEKAFILDTILSLMKTVIPTVAILTMILTMIATIATMTGWKMKLIFVKLKSSSNQQIVVMLLKFSSPTMMTNGVSTTVEKKNDPDEFNKCNLGHILMLRQQCQARQSSTCIRSITIHKILDQRLYKYNNQSYGVSDWTRMALDQMQRSTYPPQLPEVGRQFSIWSKARNCQIGHRPCEPVWWRHANYHHDCTLLITKWRNCSKCWKGLGEAASHLSWEMWHHVHSWGFVWGCFVQHLLLERDGS